MLRALIPASLAFFATLIAVAKDQITLKNKDVFVGKVVALKDGVIELETPHSATPLKVINDGLLKLNFAKTDSSELPKNSQILHLRNGDQFPGEITNLTETHVSFDTWFAGTLEVPRELIKSLNFGVTPQKVIATGPKNINDWTQQNSNGWKMNNGLMTSFRSSFIGKNFSLPENFIFGTDFAWELQPEESQKKIGDSYMISINRSGIDVKRVMPAGSKGPSYRTIITHATDLESKRGDRARIELRVNRKDRTLKLYLDGIELEQGIDPSTPPIGTNVLFQSLSNNSGDTIIHEFIIHEWDTSTQLNRLEPRESDELDTLSVNDGDRFSGQITNFNPEGSENTFTVQSPLSDEPLLIPLTHCTVMYFAKGESSPPSKGQYQLDLRSGGQLTLSNIGLGPDKLAATHPWIGDLQIDRRVMNSISKGK